MMIARARLSWDEYAMGLAVAASKRSEDPHQQVGACALDAEHRVIGVAYNGLTSGKNVDASFWADRDARRPYVLHAETNLLALIKRGECETLACTLLPCASCAAAIAAHKITRVIFRDVYQRDTNAFDIFKFYDIECVQLLQRE